MIRPNSQHPTPNSVGGFSLIEVLVFVGILSMFFVVAASVTVTSLRNMKISEHKLIATHYARELEDWLRNEKENDFATFAGNYASETGKTWCFAISPIAAWDLVDGSCGSTELISGLFKREVILRSYSSAGVVTSVSVDMTVSWLETGISYSVPVSTLFTIYE